MANQLTMPSSEIEGIGETFAAHLRGAGIYTIGDLLRATPQSIHGLISAHASLPRIRSWCQMAALLQIEGMTPRWAEALQQAGLAGPGDLRYRQFTDIRETFAAAHRERGQPEEPTDEQLFELVRDAMIIANTGALNGSVVDQNGQPVVGATVRLGRETAITDSHGRFRIVRIPLWAHSSVFVSHPEYRPGSFRLSRVLPSVAVHTMAFQLDALPQGVAPESVVLMEVRGDRLPPVGDSQVSTKSVELVDLLEWDLLTVAERSADGERIKLVSKLLVWENGRFWVPYTWVPASELVSSKPGDCYVVRAEGVAPISLDARRVGSWIAMLRAMPELGARPSAPEELDMWVARVVEELGGSGLHVEERF